jgi:hypothetical protein
MRKCKQIFISLLNDYPHELSELSTACYADVRKLYNKLNLLFC